MDTLQLQAFESWCKASTEGVLVLDAAGAIRFANPRLLDLLKLDTTPATLDELLHRTESSMPELRALFTLNSASDQAQWGDLRLPHSPGHRLNWHQVVLKEGDTACGSLTIFRDASMQGQLDVAKQSFLSMISHDLRTPLSTILGFAELMYNNLDSLSIEEQKEFVEHIIKNANQLSRYTQIALDIMYLEANLQDFPLETVSLERLVKHWLSDAWHRYSNDRLLYQNGLTEAQLAQVAPSAMHKILYILVEFAFEESQGGEPVKIELKYDQSLAHIIIQHQAPELNAAEVEVLFQLMHPRDLSESGRPRIHRMQLYLASLLARKQHGYLTLHEGENHRFQIDLALPLAAAPTPSPAPEEARTDD